MRISSNNVSSYSSVTKVAIIESDANAFTGYCRENTLRDIVYSSTINY
jgi:hypothetical protein